jgi:hypothetical protein
MKISLVPDDLFILEINLFSSMANILFLFNGELELALLSSSVDASVVVVVVVLRYPHFGTCSRFP